MAGPFDSVATIGKLIAGQQPPDVQSAYYDALYGGRLAGMFPDIDALVNRTKAANTAFSTKYAAATPKLDALAATDVEYLNRLLQKSVERQPLNDYKDIFNFQFDKIGDVSNRFKDSGAARVKLNAANLGLANRGTNYLDLQLAANQQANIAPLYAQAIAAAPNVYANTLADYYQNIATVPGLMAGRYSAIESTAGRELVPTNVERSSLAANLDLLNKLGAAHRDSKYFWVRPSDVETWTGVGAEAGNLVANLYTSYLTGGLSGIAGMGGGGASGGAGGGMGGMGNIMGMMGGMGGMGGGNSQSQPAQPRTWNWVTGNNPNPWAAQPSANNPVPSVAPYYYGPPASYAPPPAYPYYGDGLPPGPSYQRYDLPLG